MADKEEGKPEGEERHDADAGQKLDKVLAGLDAMAGRMDAMEKRMDADDERRRCDAEEREREDKARRDAEAKEGEDGARDDKGRKDKDRKDSEGAEEEGEGKPERTAADSRKDKDRKDSRKDADDKSHEESEAAAARADSVSISRSELQELRDLLKSQGTQLSDLQRAQPAARTDADYHALVEAQSRFDSVHQALGMGPVSRPMSGETVADYKLRINSGLKKFSPAWKDVNLYTISADSHAMAVCDEQIFEAAQAAARRPVDLKAGELREIKTRDAAGRLISDFVGPNSFIMGMKARTRRVGTIRNSVN